MRAAVVAEALSWERTPFKDYMAKKGVGVDCANLACAVYRAVGVIGAFEIPRYSAQGMLHGPTEVMLGIVQQWAKRELLENETPKPGDLVLYHFGKCFSHCAIVIAWPEVIHAYASAGMVMRDLGDNGWLAGKKRRVFSMFDD